MERFHITVIHFLLCLFFGVVLYKTMTQNRGLNTNPLWKCSKNWIWCSDKTCNLGFCSSIVYLYRFLYIWLTGLLFFWAPVSKVLLEISAAHMRIFVCCKLLVVFLFCMFFCFFFSFWHTARFILKLIRLLFICTLFLKVFLWSWLA